jgi:ADP-ribose pyrophosphatase YjhB (NUDIX family)
VSDEDLASFLARHTPVAREKTVWGDGTLPLELLTFLGADVPPSSLITSVRCIVLRDNGVLVMRNAHGTHIVPGGRREAGESLLATLRREVLEESGWTVREARLLGCVYFKHLAPKPPGYIYPHPHFFQVVYRATAGTFDPAAKLPDDYETDARFLPVSEVRALPLAPSEHAFLQAALASPPS